MPYAGQMFGAFWPIFHPLFLVTLLSVVFNLLLGARFGGTVQFPLDYTVFILSGLVPWYTTLTVLGRAGMEIVSNANLVKQVVFPLEVLPIKGTIPSLTTYIAGVSFIICYVLITTGSLPWTYTLLPLLFILHFLMMIGIGLLLSSLGVYFRDLKDLVRLFVTAGVYLSPIIYIPNAVPSALKPIIAVNPFSYLIWAYQDVLYFSRFEHPWAWAILTFLSISIFYIGFYLFQKLKPFFGSVL